MNSTYSFLRTTSLFPLLLLTGLFLVTVGCQPDEIGQPDDGISATDRANIPPLALEKFILDYNFSVPTKALTDEEILEQYTEYTQALSDQDRSQMLELSEQIVAQMYAQRAAPKGPPSSSGNGLSESILSADSPGDGFGQGVATVGNKVYIGTDQDQKVYEYAKKGGGYTLIGEVTPTGTSVNFGYAVAVSGSWMAVGAPDFDTDGPGQVFMFKKQGNTWVQKAVLNGPAGNLYFGQIIAINGTRLSALSLIQPSPDSDPTTTVNVFDYSGNSWTSTVTLSEPGYAFFGFDMDESGNRIVGVGSINGNLGNVSVGVFTGNGGNWSFEEVQVNPSTYNAFCRDVVIQDNTIALTTGFPGTNHFVLQQIGGSWELEAELNIPTSIPPNRWVDLHGNQIVIGVDVIFGPAPKKVYVFEKSGGTWSITNTITPSDGGANARMWDLKIHGNTIVAGFPGAFGSPGKAYVFE